MHKAEILGELVKTPPKQVVNGGYGDFLIQFSTVTSPLLTPFRKLCYPTGVGNAAAVFPELLRRGVPIDIVTDQTSAHDPLPGSGAQ